MRVLTIAGKYPPASKAGGPVKSLSGLISAESSRHDICVITSNRDLGDIRPMPGTSPSPMEREGATIHYLNPRARRAFVRQLITIGRAQREVLYLNSLFSPWFTLLPILLWRLRLIRCPVLLIAPRGELAATALAIKSAKKTITLRILRRMLSQSSIVWQATSDSEEHDILRFISSAEVVRHDNPWPAPSGIVSDRPRDFTAVFVGRISAIKNPLTAIDALMKVDSPTTFIAMGNEEDVRLSRTMHSLAEQLPPSVNSKLLGHSTDDEVAQALRSGHALLLPTSGENFGHAIAEALAAGCFILVPDSTPWSSLIRAGAGAFITPDPSEHNRDLLRSLASESPEQLHCRNLEAAELYRQAFTEHSRMTQSLFEAAQGAQKAGD